MVVMLTLISSRQRIVNGFLKRNILIYQSDVLSSLTINKKTMNYYSKYRFNS